MPSRVYIGARIQGANGIIGFKMSQSIFRLTRSVDGMTGTLILRVSSADWLSIDPMDISTTLSDYTFSLECKSDVPAVAITSGNCVQFFTNDVNFNGGSIALVAMNGGNAADFQWFRGATECTGDLAGFSLRTAGLFSDN